MTPKLTASKVNSKIEALEPRLQQIAKKISNYSADAEWENLYQHMLVKILERNVSDPTFFEQTDSFILKYGEFMARHEIKKAHVYLKYVDEEGCEIDPEDGEDDGNYSLDMMQEREKIQQSVLNVEYAVQMSELADSIIEGCDFLSASNIQIVKLLYLGYKQSEIAEELGISKPAVNQRIKTIASTLSGFVEGY